MQPPRSNKPKPEDSKQNSKQRKRETKNADAMQKPQIQQKEKSSLDPNPQI
jgi:hypothetical protein